MTTADRLHQAAARIRETANTAYNPAGNWWTADDLQNLSGSQHIALWSPALALEVAGWLDDIANDKASGLTTIHPSAATIADLILGDAS